MKNFKRSLSIVLSIFIGGGVFLGCAALPKDFKATVSMAISQSAVTALGNLIQPEAAKHPGQSGFLILNIGRQAFGARLGLADTAERTIDCQYFIWNGDSSGMILMQRLLKAAERGVRVRLLLDDITSHGKDLGLAALNLHPNIEIRLFNPLGRRYYSGLFRTLSMTFHASRMTNRMHNKIFAVDNQVAIVGGRNIGDEYFGLNKRSNFRDLELLTMGPLVNDVSHAFDAYWNSPWSVPFEIYKTKLPSKKKQEKMFKQFQQNFVKLESEFPYPIDLEKERILEILSSLNKDVIWSKAEVVCDPPGKAWKKAERGTKTSEIANKLENLVKESKDNILIVSPYFIMSDENINRMGDVDKKGISMRVLTNSLRSTDAVPVVAMYRKTRKKLLKNGVQLYEIRPDAASRSEYIAAPNSTARLGLHAKTVVFDRKKVFVGTFNIDPRSEYLNTEVGLLVDSAELSKRITSFIESDLKPQNSYKLRLNGSNVEWVCEGENGQRIYASDPLASPWLRFKAWVLGLLPISGQL
jgi:cardiolipin synthase C